MKVKVVEDLPQVLQAPETRVLRIGDKLDPLEGVIAKDLYEGDILLKVEVINNGDTSKSRESVITYQVTDSDGERSSIEEREKI
ncbi:hypothetical protein P4U07_17870 [Bacillus mycoides]|uniref:hypothetical protein n=1 Tax=Bacillus mycoides TaxID=1405 RepID=UPI002E21C319|nr:hypothetical protein [Bacillus mycoides]